MRFVPAPSCVPPNPDMDMAVDNEFYFFISRQNGSCGSAKGTFGFKLGYGAIPGCSFSSFTDIRSNRVSSVRAAIASDEGCAVLRIGLRVVFYRMAWSVGLLSTAFEM